MMDGMRIAVLDDYQQVADHYGDFTGRLPEAEVDFVAEHLGPDELVERIAGCEVVVAMRERTPFGRDVLQRLPDLKLLVTTGMRNAAIDVAAATDLGITVCGTGGYGSATTELTWALILGLVRPVWADDAAIRDGGWQSRVGGDLSGRTLGLLGLGRLGGNVARIGQAFGMRTIAWSQNLTAERAAEQGVTRVERADLFAQADVLSIHLVLSDRTRGIVGRDDLARMKPTAYLVNSARAGLVDADALRELIESERLAGVALDVYDSEPLPADHWLRTSKRTLLSPHMGYVSDGGYRVFYGEVVEDILAYLDGSAIRVISS